MSWVAYLILFALGVATILIAVLGDTPGGPKPA